jgi:hypothetical protein
VRPARGLDGGAAGDGLVVAARAVFAAGGATVAPPPHPASPHPASPHPASPHPASPHPASSAATMIAASGVRRDHVMLSPATLTFSFSF